jgi:hypothetical protein
VSGEGRGPLPGDRRGSDPVSGNPGKSRGPDLRLGFDLGISFYISLLQFGSFSI